MDITAAEAARRIGVSREMAVRWAHGGCFDGARQTRVGGEWLIPEKSVEKLRREREHKS